jgi:ABC-type nickel/cobalt efflux system permease component RcnA
VKLGFTWRLQENRLAAVNILPEPPRRHQRTSIFANVISVLAGAVAGMVHVLSGPDHLAAVAPLAAERHESGWLTGARWGLGHATGVVLVGVLALLLREALPLDLLTGWAERSVGVMLIAIGIWGARKALRSHVHLHEHAHDGRRHVHVHVHDGGTAHDHRSGEGRSHGHTHAAFAVGTLHGLAGSSHFLGVLPMLALPTDTEAVVYLMAFGGGTIAAMAGFSSAVGWLARGLALGGHRVYRALMFGCSAAAGGIGVYWLVWPAL